MNETRFKVVGKLGKDVTSDPLEFVVTTADEKKELSLTWDCVYDAAMDRLDETFSTEDFPNMDVSSIAIVTEDGEFPVVSDEAQKPNGVSRVLVLPCERYSMTAEFATYMKLLDAGLVDFDHDQKKMENLISIVRETLSQLSYFETTIGGVSENTLREYINRQG